MTDGTWITLISLGVTFLFMLGTPVLLIIAYWVIGCSFVLDLTLDNMGAEMLNVFKDGFALLAMPLFILTGDLINKSGHRKTIVRLCLCLSGVAARRSCDGLHRRLRPLRRDLGLELGHHRDHRLDAASRNGQRRL